MNILMTGATGLIGRELGKALVQNGHRLFIVTRDREKTMRDLAFPCHVIECDLIQDPIRDDRLRQIEVVFHLAGENLSNKRWTRAQKQIIYDSRVKGTQNLIQSLQDMAKLKLFISTSAIGYYGNRDSEELTEVSSRGQGFVSDLCVDWEYPVYLAERKKTFPSCRYIILRTGLVLARQGGFLERIKESFRQGLTFVMGDGNQWMSWIHIEDLVRLYLHCLNHNEVSGVLNAVSPEPITFRFFADKLATFFHKKVRFRIPRSVLRFLLGEMSSLVFDSERVYPRALETSAFQFQYSSLESALESFYSKEQKGMSFYSCEQYLSQGIDQVRKMMTDLEIQNPFLKKMIQSWASTQDLTSLSEGTYIFESVEYTLRGTNLMKLIFEFLIRRELNRKFQIRRAMLTESSP